MSAPTRRIVLVQDDAASLKLTEERCREWGGGAVVLLWNRLGMIRKISYAVLNNALWMLADQNQLLKAGVIIELPKGCDCITWEQGEDVTNG